MRGDGSMNQVDFKSLALDVYAIAVGTLHCSGYTG
jgi:hypothetical protein